MKEEGVARPQRAFLRMPFWVAASLTCAALGTLTVLHPTLAILLVLGTALAALALIDVSILVAAALLLHMLGETWRLSYESLSLGGVDLYANDLLTLGLLAAAVLTGLKAGEVPRLSRDAVSMSLTLFLAYGVFTVLRSVPMNGKDALLGFRQQFFYALLFFLAKDVLREERARRRLLYVLLGAAVGVSLIGVWNLLTGTYTGALTGSRTYRFLSGFQAMTLFFALSLLLGTVWNRGRPAWSFPLAALFLLGILVSQARSVWLAGAVGLLVGALGSRAWRRGLVRAGIPAAAFLLVLLALAGAFGKLPINDYLTARVASLGDLSGDVTALWRLFVWSEALQRLSANPLLGLGLGEPFIFFDAARGFWETTRQMHNSYLELAYYSGAVGVGLLILFQTLVLKRVLGAARRQGGRPRGSVLMALASCQVCLIGVSFANVVGASMVTTTYVWILSAVSVLEAEEADRQIGAASAAR